MHSFQGPTDNLYKFLALFGLAIITISLVLIDNLNKEITDAMIRSELSSMRFKYFAEAQNKMLETTSKTAALRGEINRIKLDNKDLTMDKLNDAESELKKITEDADKYYASSKEIYDEATKAFNDSNTVTYLLNGIRKKLFSYYIMLFIGFILSAFGFFLWYHKLQKFLDREISNRSELTL